MQMYSLYCDFKCGKMQRSIVVIGLDWVGSEALDS